MRITAILLILIFVPTFMFAQNMKISYLCEGRIKPNVLKKEIALLYINEKKESLFFTEAFFKRDSILKYVQNNKGTDIYQSVEKIQLISVNSFLEEFIRKDYSNNSISSYIVKTPNEFNYIQTIDFNWQIGNEQEKILSYDCKIATCTYSGRNYKAWFTEKIATSDGPFKFRGLPGLIIKIEDDQNFFKFEMVGINIQQKSITLEPIFFKQAKTVSFKDFLKIRADHEENPLKGFTDAGFTISYIDPEVLKKKNNTVKKNYIEIN